MCKESIEDGQHLASVQILYAFWCFDLRLENCCFLHDTVDECCGRTCFPFKSCLFHRLAYSRKASRADHATTTDSSGLSKINHIVILREIQQTPKAKRSAIWVVLFPVDKIGITVGINENRRRRSDNVSDSMFGRACFYIVDGEVSPPASHLNPSTPARF